jgi:transposase
LFPQFVKNPVSGIHIALPKLGLIPINLHRQIPSGFVVKQVRIINKADRWYASINIQCDVSIPNLRKDLSVRVHSCSSCGYTTDRDVASGQVIRNRGIELISTDGQSGIQNAYADGLPGIEMSQFRSMSKSRKGVTRKSKK